jgi:hypothetical protein
MKFTLTCLQAALGPQQVIDEIAKIIAKPVLVIACLPRHPDRAGMPSTRTPGPSRCRGRVSRVTRS